VITKIKARYESHPDSEIELDSGLTVLLGTNDHGKSGFNRVVSWVATGIPRGDDMIPWTGKKQAWGEVEVNGNTVRRQKGPANTYTVNGLTLKAIGNSVPDEVQEVLNIDTINLQRQVDQYFILQWTPGEVAKHINVIAGIEESDKAIKLSKERISAAESEIKILKADIVSCNNFLDQHEQHVIAAGELLKEISADEGWVSQAELSIQKAEVLSTDVKDSQAKLERFPDYEQAEEGLREIGLLGQDVEQGTKHLADAVVLRDAISDINLHKFIVLDDASVEPLEEAEAEIEWITNQISDMTATSNELKRIDLGKTEVVTDPELMSKILDIESIKIKASLIQRRLDSMKSAMSAFDSVQLSSYEVLNSADVSELETISRDLLSLNATLAILKDANEAFIEMDKLDDYLLICQGELEQLEEQCPTCGQTVRGSDVIIHLHS